MKLVRQARVVLFLLLGMGSVGPGMANCGVEEHDRRSRDAVRDGSQPRSHQDRTPTGKQLSCFAYQYGITAHPNLQCVAPQMLPCDASTNKPIKNSTTQRDPENVSVKSKDEKMRELLETPFLNRSRPIAWIDDYNVSTGNILYLYLLSFFSSILSFHHLLSLQYTLGMLHMV